MTKFNSDFTTLGANDLMSYADRAIKGNRNPWPHLRRSHLKVIDTARSSACIMPFGMNDSKIFYLFLQEKMLLLSGMNPLGVLAFYLMQEGYNDFLKTPVDVRATVNSFEMSQVLSVRHHIKQEPGYTTYADKAWVTEMLDHCERLPHFSAFEPLVRGYLDKIHAGAPAILSPSEFAILCAVFRIEVTDIADGELWRERFSLLLSVLA